MPADISRRQAAEIAEVRHWHAHAPESKVVVWLPCRVPRTFRKWRWTYGRYTCECCGAYNVSDEVIDPSRAKQDGGC